MGLIHNWHSCSRHYHICQDMCAPADPHASRPGLQQTERTARLCKAAAPPLKSTRCQGFTLELVICFETPLHIQVENLIPFTKIKLIQTTASCATLVELYAFLVEAAFYNKYISVWIG